MRVDTDDPAAGYLATLAAAHPSELVAVLRRAPERTVEVQLRLAQALIDAGRWDETAALLAEIEDRDPWEWRAHWYRGIAALARDEPAAAAASFELVYHAVPGELAPKLALAVSAEMAGDPAGAAGWYDIVSRTDSSYATAAFGLARCRLACGDRAGALAAYERVPESASAHDEAQTARVRCLLGGIPGVADLRAAGEAIDALAIGSERRALLTAELLRAAVELVERDPAVVGSRRDARRSRARRHRSAPRARAHVSLARGGRADPGRAHPPRRRGQPRAAADVDVSAFAVAAFHDPALAVGAERVEATVWIRAAGIAAAGVAAALRVWTPAGCSVAALREIEPGSRDLLADGVLVDDRTVEFACGRWFDGVYEYELEIALPARSAGEEMLAARVGVVAGRELAGQALIAVTWAERAPQASSAGRGDLPPGASAEPPGEPPTGASAEPPGELPTGASARASRRAADRRLRQSLPASCRPAPRRSGPGRAARRAAPTPCAACGALPEDGDRFCEACGRKLAGA